MVRKVPGVQYGGKCISDCSLISAATLNKLQSEKLDD